MPIEFKNDRALFLDTVTVEEAEGLLEWLQQMPSAKLDLSACCHLHTASLQVMMAAQPAISKWPQDAKLRAWLETALAADKDKKKPRKPNRRNSQRTAALHKGKVSGTVAEDAPEPAAVDPAPLGAAHGNDNSRRR